MVKEARDFYLLQTYNFFILITKSYCDDLRSHTTFVTVRIFLHFKFQDSNREYMTLT